MKNILLIGCGRFGQRIAKKLNDMDAQVMAVDRSEERVAATAPFVTNAIVGDATDTGFLKTLGIRNFDACVVAVGDDVLSSIEIASLLKDMGAAEWSRVRRRIFRSSCFCGTARTRSFSRRSRWPHGQPSASGPTTSSIT